jgi:hypothetical protein
MLAYDVQLSGAMRLVGNRFYHWERNKYNCDSMIHYINIESSMMHRFIDLLRKKRVGTHHAVIIQKLNS